MPLGLLFWSIYILSLVFGFWVNYTPGQPFNARPFGGFLVFWVLIGLLGYHAFGAAVR